MPTHYIQQHICKIARVTCSLLPVFVLAFLFACSNRDVEPDTNILGYNYFPLETGLYYEYEVEEISFTPAVIDSIVNRFQIKEVIADTFTNLSGEKSFRINRYSRLNEGREWKLDSIWTASRTVNQAVRTENNISYVKLAFPLKNGVTWNGNAMNHMDTLGVEYKVTNFDKPYTVLQQGFYATLKVVQRDIENYIEQKKDMEVYAREVGLIYNEKIDVKFCTENSTCVDDETKINSGRKVYQRLLKYGKE